MIVRPLLLALLLLAVACSDKPSSEPVYNGPEAPLYELVEDLRIISSDSSGSALQSVNGLTVLSDGSIVTAHQSQLLVRVFTPNGEFVRAFGNGGPGPGALASISRIGSVSDSIWVDDTQSNMIKLFSREGRFVRVMPKASGAIHLGPEDKLGPMRLDMLVGYLPGLRAFTMEQYRSRPSRPGSIGQVDSTIYSVRDSVRRTMRRLLHVAAPRHKDMDPQERGNSTFSQPLVGRVAHAIAPGGLRLVLASDAEVWGGEPGQTQFTEVGADGSSTTRVVSLPPIRVSPNYRDSLIMARGGVGKSPAASQSPNAIEREPTDFEKRVRRDMYVPRYHPVNRGLMLGRDGSIWLDYKYDGLSWTVIDENGLSMRVRVPAGLRLFEVSKQFAWGVPTDVAGVRPIVRYRVLRSGSAK